MHGRSVERVRQSIANADRTAETAAVIARLIQLPPGMAYAAGTSARIVVETIAFRSSASSYMKGLSDDPGWRKACDAVVAPERFIGKVVRRADVG